MPGVDEQFQAELMDRLTHPTGSGVAMTERAYHAWVHRDLEPALHREAYMHVLQSSGLSDPHARALYQRVIDPMRDAPPDTADVLNALSGKGIRTAVVSNIAWDIRSSFTSAGVHADEFVLSFEFGATKPDLRIFQAALDRLGWTPPRPSWWATARRTTARPGSWAAGSSWWTRCPRPNAPPACATGCGSSAWRCERAGDHQTFATFERLRVPLVARRSGKPHHSARPPSPRAQPTQ